MSCIQINPTDKNSGSFAYEFLLQLSPVHNEKVRFLLDHFHSPTYHHQLNFEKSDIFRNWFGSSQSSRATLTHNLTFIPDLKDETENHFLASRAYM